MMQQFQRAKSGAKFLSILMALSMVLCLLPATALAADEEEDGVVYALMNIPYDEFYNAVGVSDSNNYDAISTATNKVGNYGKSSGGYHGNVATEADGEAVGGANGAKIEGVIWPVKITKADLTALGGTEVTDDDKKTVATLGKGQTSTTTVVGYQTLMEAKEYSYYILSDEEPANYIDWASGTSKESEQSGNGSVEKVTYGGNWGDVQLALTGVDDAANCIINAVVVTAKDSNGETSVGFVHLYNVWSAADMAWKVAQTPGLDGKTITNIRYYCSVKDDDNTDGSAPDYVNYVYDYSVSDGEIAPVYTGTLTAKFDSASQITVSGLPTNAENVQAKVYYNPGGRNAVYTYLTPLEADPNDGDFDPTTVDVDIDPTTAAVTNGKITISAGLVTVTNNAGEPKTYGQPVDGTTYTIELRSDNWVFNKITATYTARSASGGNSGSSGGGSTSGGSSNSGSGSSSSSGGSTTTTDRTYDVRVSSTSGGTVTVSPEDAKKGETVTLTITPNDGYELDTLTVTSAANKEVDVTVNGNTATFTMPSATATIKATFKQIADDTTDTTPTTPEAPDNTPRSGFEDVPDMSPFSGAVAWAIENNVTEGYDDGTFGPKVTCTNNHILTFLWRSQGSPDAEGETDFEKALAWAIENGIADADVNGDNSCTRADAVMYLWRLAGSPETDGASFLDVDADAEYADAVAWALSQGITTGVTPDYFEPDTICNRGQIVTFLYRAYA